MYIATMDTRHFEFAACGETEHRALLNLHNAFIHHLKTYREGYQGQPVTWSEKERPTAYYGAGTYDTTKGTWFRDGEILRR